jgi:hypothetical protein
VGLSRWRDAVGDNSPSRDALADFAGAGLPGLIFAGSALLGRPTRRGFCLIIGALMIDGKRQVR